jgi:hypothetical protein
MLGRAQQKRSRPLGQAPLLRPSPYFAALVAALDVPEKQSCVPAPSSTMLKSTRPMSDSSSLPAPR